MSRGLGILQRRLLEVLNASDRYRGAVELGLLVHHGDACATRALLTHSQHNATKHALLRLHQRGLIDHQTVTQPGYSKVLWASLQTMAAFEQL